MKRILLLSILLPFYAAAQQSFYKRVVILSIGIDLGAYRTLSEDPQSNSKKKDGAVSSIVPISVEYGLTDQLGVGMQIRSNKYGGGNDTTVAANSDLSLLANMHFIRTDYFNVYVGLKYGFSAFRFENKINRNIFTANGGHLQLDAGVNLFVGKRIGFQLHAAYNGLYYHNGIITDDKGNSYTYSLSLNGANIGAALLIKI